MIRHNLKTNNCKKTFIGDILTPFKNISNSYILEKQN